MGDEVLDGGGELPMLPPGNVPLENDDIIRSPNGLTQGVMSRASTAKPGLDLSANRDDFHLGFMALRNPGFTRCRIYLCPKRKAKATQARIEYELLQSREEDDAMYRRFSRTLFDDDEDSVNRSPLAEDGTEGEGKGEGEGEGEVEGISNSSSSSSNNNNININNNNNNNNGGGGGDQVVGEVFGISGDEKVVAWAQNAFREVQSQQEGTGTWGLPTTVADAEASPSPKLLLKAIAGSKTTPEIVEAGKEIPAEILAGDGKDSRQDSRVPRKRFPLTRRWEAAKKDQRALPAQTGDNESDISDSTESELSWQQTEADRALREGERVHNQLRGELRELKAEAEDMAYLPTELAVDAYGSPVDSMSLRAFRRVYDAFVRSELLAVDLAVLEAEYTWQTGKPTNDAGANGDEEGRGNSETNSSVDGSGVTDDYIPSERRPRLPRLRKRRRSKGDDSVIDTYTDTDTDTDSDSVSDRESMAIDVDAEDDALMDMWAGLPRDQRVQDPNDPEQLGRARAVPGMARERRKWSEVETRALLAVSPAPTLIFNLILNLTLTLTQTQTLTLTLTPHRECARTVKDTGQRFCTTHYLRSPSHTVPKLISRTK